MPSTDRHGKQIKIGDHVKLTGTVDEIFPNGRCLVKLAALTKMNKVSVLISTVELSDAPPPQNPGGEP